MNNTEYILSQLQLYYDCKLSDAEEARLRILVARSESDCPEIERARALMGFRRPRRRRRRPAFAAAAAAAVLVLVAAAAIWLTGARQETPGTSYAYCGGVYVSNESRILEIVAQNMSEFGDDIDAADHSIASDLNEFAEFIDNINQQ